VVGTRALLVAAFVGFLLVPLASARTAPRLKLSLVPLPKSSLGSAARGLALAPDSGVLTNSDVPVGFKSAGRLTGYVLDYGDAYRGGTGVTAIETDVNKYRTAAAARRGLALGRKGDVTGVASLKDAGLAYAGENLARPKLGERSFAFLWTSSIVGVDPVSVVDLQWTEGPFTLQVEVAAGSHATAESLARKLAKRLDRRLQLGLAGRLRGRPVRLPPRPKAGPPPGGPSLAALALQPSDLGGTATIEDQAYAADPPALSEYNLDLQPAGPFGDLTQLIDWWPTTNEAAFFSNVEFPLAASELSAFAGVAPQITPVDVSTVGDAAQAEILQLTPSGGPTVDFAVVSLSSSQATNFILAGSQSPIQSLDVQNLAQAAASRLDAGLAG
jgi:hypothetical protein